MFFLLQNRGTRWVVGNPCRLSYQSGCRGSCNLVAKDETEISGLDCRGQRKNGKKKKKKRPEVRRLRRCCPLPPGRHAAIPGEPCLSKVESWRLGISRG